ncbi:DHHW family protein [Kosakonia sp. LAM2021]|uniref:DHHW family protein n=1 Tax=Kosakonia sp. LAM2021 TaxID=2800475 RepID=UPI00190BF5DB|nr:DHHW family protein [Kosakonia sp. LAM2021]
MKKHVFTFLIVSALMLTLLPIYNFLNWNKGLTEYIKTSQYYKLDSVTAPVSKILSTYGISLFPDQVIVGRNGWLYLGDQESNTVSNRRKGATKNDIENAQKISVSVQQWNDFFMENGVKKFKILVGPDKESIYGEYLPQWARPAEYRQVSAILDADKKGIFVDPTKYLIEQKSKYKEPLYYKTDTHWNALGGWLAFSYFMKNVFNDESYRSENTGKYTGWQNKAGGDLSRFLRTENFTIDHYQEVDVLSKESLDIEKYDFATDSLISKSVNVLIDAPSKPIRVVSSKARNNAKVLWLRDSFGTAMSPFMASSFTNVVQLHYFGSNPVWLYNVIKTYKPDYVFVTSVERSIINDFFLSPPPVHALKTASLDNMIVGQYDNSHDVKRKDDTYEIIGNDPFIVFRFNSIINTQKDSIYINVNCKKNKSDLMTQFFWSTDKGDFSEENSISMILPQNGAVFDMTKIAHWRKAQGIKKIRFDIQPDSIENCRDFSIGEIKITH